MSGQWRAHNTVPTQQSCPRPISRGGADGRGVYQLRDNFMVIYVTRGEVNAPTSRRAMIRSAAEW